MICEYKNLYHPVVRKARKNKKALESEPLTNQGNVNDLTYEEPYFSQSPLVSL